MIDIICAMNRVECYDYCGYCYCMGGVRDRG